ncbi:hypothetical protein Sulku_1527 [Sulfuricurvum kujiense DSM 16994]|uniref:Response regulatory domain-containing protein n=1 Tax=Sulfuricurvum kujiense (strain ATCC BAA-921 / DSM 16994 / JCM 11577 / YK-1) TaxID=709032 RepID=E4TZT2_SULKY|nr:hypothetical protein [Sulfuricurvum kujiense]ADR34189.1 hypothetical protein Sulku_1527 [Sulfuricurvum kujiense DSM 16994]
MSNSNTEEFSDTKKKADNSDETLPEVITTEEAIQGYFQDLRTRVSQFSDYQNERHEIDFLLLRRFLMTAYNNLVEIDMSLTDTPVFPIRNDVLKLSQIYDQFKFRALHVKRAFFELFLDNHDVFLKYQKRRDENKESIATYDIMIRTTDASLEQVESEMKNVSIESEEYAPLMKQLKVLRAKSVDSVHNKRRLEDENIQLTLYLDMIINENEESFTKKFSSMAAVFEQEITTLLNKAAYLLDFSLWKNARKSNMISKYFSELPIQGEISSQTYLRYYLQTLNEEKLTDEHRTLIKLLPYLESLKKISVLYLSSDAESSKRLTGIFASLSVKIELQCTSDVLNAINLIKKNLPKYIFVDYQSDFKTLIKVLKNFPNYDEVTVILLVDGPNDINDERLQQGSINHIIGTRISKQSLVDKFEDIFNME